MKWIFTFLLKLVAGGILVAQGIHSAFRYDTIPVFQGNDSLLNPFAGGLNNPQFSAGDLNYDGKSDLFIFDRSGNKPMVFLNEGIPGAPKYVYKHYFMNYFPTVSPYSPFIENWALLRDYDCNGTPDLFTSAPGGIAVYRNDGTTTPLFNLYTGLLLSNYQPNNLNIYVSSADIPGIEDIDKDGDLDILTFEVLGTYLEYHRNYSMENTGSCDTLAFVLKNKCWGHFSENMMSNSINLFDTCNYNVAGPQKVSGGNKHSGSTVCIIETNNNDARDLVLGDISYPNLTLLTNCGTVPNMNTSMCAYDTAFPENHLNTQPAVMNTFPAAFWLDVDDDGKRDLLVAPNATGTGVSENYYNVWFYKNNGTYFSPDYTLVKKNYMTESMVDVGEGATVCVVDIDGDQLQDLIIGNYTYYDSAGAMLAFYKNTGSALQPKFTLISHNFANLPSYNLNTGANAPAKGIAPAFGDLDNDGDPDMLIGDSEGKIHYFSNNSGNFQLLQANYAGIDVGEYATPQLFDLNNDGLLDLIIGEKDGNLNYYENTGSATNPVFSLVSQNLGNVQVKTWWDYQGYSYPFFYKHGQETRLLCGSKSGYLHYYDSIDNNLNGKFRRLDTAYMNIWEGIRSTVSGGFLAGNDSLVDFFVGNYNGGIAFYKGNGFIAPASLTEFSLSRASFTLYPNPADQYIKIGVADPLVRLSDLTVLIYDMTGKILVSCPYTIDPLSISHLAPGIYQVSLQFHQKSYAPAHKLIILR